MQRPEHEDYIFINEMIRKKPFYRKKWFGKLLWTAFFAVLFGLISGVTFFAVQSLAGKLTGVPKDPDDIVLLPKETETSSDTETGSESADAESESEAAEETLDTQLDMNAYGALYEEMSAVAAQASESIVTVTGSVSDLNLFNEVDERRIQSSGLAVGQAGSDLFILTEARVTEDAGEITVAFSDGQTVEAQIHKTDSILGMSLVRVALSDIPEDTPVTVADLNYSSSADAGTPVIAVGSPLGYSDSMAFGMITSVISLAVTDDQYTLLTTDMAGSSQGSGILLNLQGEVIGILGQRFSSDESQSVLTGVEISCIYKDIIDMINDTPLAYLGICGRDVSQSIALELDMPFGMFIREVAEGSPAMLAGVQGADILTAIDGEAVRSIADYAALLKKHSPGDTVVLTIERKSLDRYVSLDLTITLAERES